MTRFRELGTYPPTDLGPCQCPGTPHERDEAVQYTLLGWDDVADIAVASSEGAARRVMVTRSIASWTLLDWERDADGAPTDRLAPVPITDATVRLLTKESADALWPRAFEAFSASRDPLPNGSGAGSPRSPQEPESSTPTTRRTAKPTP